MALWSTKPAPLNGHVGSNPTTDTYRGIDWRWTQPRLIPWNDEDSIASSASFENVDFELYGSVAEWMMASVLKTEGPNGLVSSNLTASSLIYVVAEWPKVIGS